MRQLDITSIDQLADKTNEELRDIYAATFGIYPPKNDSVNRLLSVFESHLSFGRKLFTLS